MICPGSLQKARLPGPELPQTYLASLLPRQDALPKEGTDQHFTRFLVLPVQWTVYLFTHSEYLYIAPRCLYPPMKTFKRV